MNARKIIKNLASIKLAVIVILSIASITAVGTFVESEYDANAAKKWVYDSFWMYAVMGLFAVNLTAVLVDRWPWKVRHLPFICAHIGILMILTGAILTMNYGLDGNLRIGIGEKNNMVVTQNTVMAIYTSDDGNNFKLARPDMRVDFFRHPPTADHPLTLLDNEPDLQVVDYKPYVSPERKIVKSEEPGRGAGIRFQITNGQANMIEWVVQKSPFHMAQQDLGPLLVSLGPQQERGHGGNEILLSPIAGSEDLHYTIFQKGTIEAPKKGTVAEGKSFQTPWMGLEFHLLRYLPKADEKWEVTQRERPTPLTTEAVQVSYKGQKRWVLMDDTVKFFSGEKVFFVAYAHEQIPLGFTMQLKQFEVSKYGGSLKASGYMSHVSVPGLGDREISMNEPLKHNGLTIYQASFQDGPLGKPVASVFSVNRDPGRWWKYLGSLVMVMGIILLFYFRKKFAVAASKAAQKAEAS